MHLCVWIIAALALLGASPAAKIQSMLAKPKVLCGRFDQTKQLVGLKKPVKSSGRFCVVADKGVLWRSERPFANTIKLTRDEIVQLQGDRVALRLDAKKEPTVRVINSVLFALLAGDLDQLEKLFEIDGSVSNQSWSVTLKARQPALAKAVGAIALDGAEYVKNIIIDESGGDRTSIVFSAIQTGDGAMTVDEAALF
jgi:outer membrane lipoprotein carrier protein LolA